MSGATVAGTLPFDLFSHHETCCCRNFLSGVLMSSANAFWLPATAMARSSGSWVLVMCGHRTTSDLVTATGLLVRGSPPYPAPMRGAFKGKAGTPFAERVREALTGADLDQTGAAAALSKLCGRKIKQQTVQWLTSKAKDSALTADLAQICGVRYRWLAYGEAPKAPEAAPAAISPAQVKTLLSDLEWALEQAHKRPRPGRLPDVASILYEMALESGHSPSRRVILELVRRVA